MRKFDHESVVAAFELEQMVADYCHLLDRNEGVKGSEFFTEDCIVQAGLISYRSRAEMKRFYSELAERVSADQKDGTWTSRHGFTNFRVVFPASDRATVNFLFVNFSGAGHAPLLNATKPSIVSDARMECRREADGQWRIHEFYGAPIFLGDDPHLNKTVMGMDSAS
jgi:hypothetical protein